MSSAESSLRDLLLGNLDDSVSDIPPDDSNRITVTSLTPTLANGMLLSALLDHAQPIYAASMDGTLAAYSRAFSEIYHDVFSASGTFEELISQLREKPDEIRKSDTIGEGGKTRHFISRHFRICDDRGTLLGFGGVYEDVSALARSARRAGEVESWLQDVIRSSSDWVWSMDQHHNLTFASARISDLLEEPVQSILGRHLFSLGCFDTTDPLTAKTQDDIKRRSPFRGRKFLLTNRNGKTCQILLSAVPVFDEMNGTFKGYRGTGTDITGKLETEQLMQATSRRLEETLSELRQRNEELHIALDHAKVADKGKLDFLTMMSHELKTPLNGIIGFSDAALQKVHGPVPPAYNEYFEHIHNAGQHLLAIINDLLEITNTGRDDLAVNIRPESVDRMIKEAVSLVDLGAGRDTLDVSALKISTDLTARCDHLRTRQILVNLLANAVKFTPDRGRIGIDVATRDDGMIALTVWDTGIGIPADQQERVFEKFYQVEKNMLSRGTAGTGLGLNISRHLARLMGGDLTLASVPGKGSRFTLILPKDSHRQTR